MDDGAPDPVDCVGAVVTAVGSGARGAEALLLVRRRHPPGAGLWSLPGGRVEPGEDDAAAVAREVAEETGLAVTVGALVGTVRLDAGNGCVLVVRDYRATPLAAGAPDPVAGDDASDVRWVGAADYAAMDAAGQLVPGLTAALAEWGCLPAP